MEFLTRFSLKNSAAVIIIVALITLGGIVSALSLKVENMPDISFPVVVVETIYPNASPEDVLDDVTKPLEKAVDKIEGIKYLNTISRDNASVLVIMLNSGVDVDKARDEVERKVSGVKLPVDAERPQISTEGFSSEPIYYISIAPKNESASPESLDSLITDTIKPELEGITGVDSVSVVGDRIRKVRIYPKLAALNQYGFSASQFKQLVLSNHVGIPAGTVKINGEDNAVRVLTKFTNIEQIRNTKLFLPAGMNGGFSYVKIGDIADVEFEVKQEHISYLDGKPGISLRVYKSREGNTVETGKLVTQKLEEMRKRYPDLQIKTVYDSSVNIKNSISGMMNEGIMGAVMASIMILIFLRNIKSTVIVLVSIPLSILVSLIFMNWLGLTLNMMTLFGMAIAVGRVVDDSIVVIENIFRHLQMNQVRNITLIRLAAKEVTNAITSSTITTIAVFAPIAFVSGIVGEVFRPFAITVVCSLLASLLVAVTVVPLMTKLLLLRSTKVKEHKPGRLTNLYVNLLTWSLGHKLLTVAIALVLFVGSFGLVSLLNVSMFGDSKLGIIQTQLTMPKGTTLEATASMTDKLQAVMQKHPGVDYIETVIGSNDQANKSAMFIMLKDSADANAVVKAFRQETDPLIPAETKFAINKISNGANEAYEVVLNGPSKEALQEAAEQVKEHMKQNPELFNINDNLSDKKSEVIVRVDRDKAAEWGLSPSQISGDINSLVGGNKIGKIKIDEEEYDFMLGLKEEDSNSVEKIKGIQLRTPAGQQVFLSDIADVKKEDAPAEIMRRDKKEYISITADIASANKEGVSSAENEALRKLSLPAGVSISSGGVSEDMQKSFTEMFYALGAAVVMVYIVMVIAFGNAMAPLSILLSLPLAAIGGLVGLFVTRSTLDLTALIGFLMLIGVVVTNAIVYVDRVQQQREAGMPIREALLEAGVTRLRPILMTALATIVALLPLGLGEVKGSLMSPGLAIVVIGGLTTSTLLTLVVVPVGYEALDRLRAKFLRKNKSGEGHIPDQDVEQSV
ncbi:efflux RND transporter permease subunit [Aneurinibacillus uraniidurans]|uniref:efflux RND transporter permease subunit n=1 Tax=Aneurinibacillus uraniidurans TaxID=2966586 RepID=UPI00234ADF36|nr:efflux RND transporter permease subunit [Aneurinibacillus sp. B1]WCN37540.1 efflux RND transporter permease subunit [Aneurinibacillus sp. B1]